MTPRYIFDEIGRGEAPVGRETTPPRKERRASPAARAEPRPTGSNKDAAIFEKLGYKQALP